MSTTAAKMRENSRRKEHKDKSMKIFPSITDIFFSREKIAIHLPALFCSQ